MTSGILKKEKIAMVVMLNVIIAILMVTTIAIMLVLIDSGIIITLIFKANYLK